MDDDPEMFRFADSADRGGIGIGKVAYSVLAAVSLCAYFLPRFLMAKMTYFSFAFIIPAIFLSLVLTVIGVARIAYFNRKGVLSRFWQFATFFAAIPLITTLLLLILGILTNSPPVF